MRRVVSAAVFLLACPIALAQMMHGHAMASPEATSPCNKELALAELQGEFQEVKWPAIKSNSDALPFFEQGMTQYYGLNYEEAMRNFKMAKKKDEKFAMASWGIALAAGPNINLNMTDACHCLAKKEIKHAACLAGVPTTIDLCPVDKDKKEDCEPAPAGSITQLEKDLIGALQKRYAYLVPAEARVAAEHYRDDMTAVSKNHSGDKNVSTLYAESMMDLFPWDQYNKDGQPINNTDTILGVLEKSTGNVPERIGANHYYIHAIEGSLKLRIDPETAGKAKESADWLQNQVPKSGHLVHMSSHIYLLRGGYHDSLDANIKGANNDVEQYSDACSGPYEKYNADKNCPQLYYGHYLSHNYLFGSVSATFMGRSKDALALACDTQAHVQRFVAYEPGLQRYLAAPLMTLVVNRNWDAICDKTETDCEGPNPSDPEFKKPVFDDCYRQDPFKKDDCLVLRSIWYWARGMARAARGMERVARDENGDADFNAAADDLTAMKRVIGLIDIIDPCSATNRTSHNTFGNNCARDVLEVGQKILKARIEWAKVPQTGTAQFFKSLTHESSPVIAEDKLVYDEPPQWFTPAREAIGGAYLQAAKVSSSTNYSDALVLFEEALSRHPKSGRALYGKMRALQGLGSAEAAERAKEDFCNVWSDAPGHKMPADYTMTDADLWPAASKDAQDDYVVSCPKVEKKEPSKCACQSPIWSTWPPPSKSFDVRADIPIKENPFVKCPQ